MYSTIFFVRIKIGVFNSVLTPYLSISPVSAQQVKSRRAKNAYFDGFT